MNPDSIAVPSMLELFAQQGKKTGVVVTCSVTHATPADFIAHNINRNNNAEIALEISEKDGLDVLFGGGKKYFAERKDSLDLLGKMWEKGWNIYDSLEQIEDNNARTMVLTCEKHMVKAPERGDYLPKATAKAIEMLDNENGFFLMVEGSQIDFACHDNDSATMVEEMIDFNKAINVALDFAEKDGNTLVVVTADHETGGLTIVDPEGLQYPSATFVRNGVANDITNSYYTTALGTVQGKQARSITAGENVTVVNAGTPETIYTTSGITAYTGGGRYNDMDMLVVGYGNKRSGLTRGTGLTFQEEEAHFGLWCIMSSPLMLGCDLAYLPEDTRALVTNPELIAINQDPLGIQPQVVQFDGTGYVLVKDLKIHRGKERAVALYNPSDEPHHFECPLELLAFEGTVKMRDALRREDLGSVDRISMDLPAHSARILTIKGVQGIEQKEYEAEWGYIPAYNDIGQGGAKYVPTDGASCGAVVKGLGGSAENRLELDVHRFKGGKWKAGLVYCSSEACTVTVDVNGSLQQLELPATEGFASAPLVLKLHAGCNKVSFIKEDGDLPAALDKLVFI